MDTINGYITVTCQPLKENGRPYETVHELQLRQDRYVLATRLSFSLNEIKEGGPEIPYSRIQTGHLVRGQCFAFLPENDSMVRPELREPPAFDGAEKLWFVVNGLRTRLEAPIAEKTFVIPSTPPANTKWHRFHFMNGQFMVSRPDYIPFNRVGDDGKTSAVLPPDIKVGDTIRFEVVNGCTDDLVVERIDELAE